MAQEIAREHWTRFLDDFSRKYRGWNAGIEVEGEEDRLPVRNLPLLGMTADEKDGENLISVMVGDPPAIHDTHNIMDPSVVRVDDEDVATAAITIESGSGETTHVRLTAPPIL
jgi:hypothetical protein